MLQRGGGHVCVWLCGRDARVCWGHWHSNLCSLLWQNTFRSENPFWSQWVVFSSSYLVFFPSFSSFLSTDGEFNWPFLHPCFSVSHVYLRPVYISCFLLASSRAFFTMKSIQPSFSLSLSLSLSISLSLSFSPSLSSQPFRTFRLNNTNSMQLKSLGETFKRATALWVAVPQGTLGISLPSLTCSAPP